MSCDDHVMSVYTVNNLSSYMENHLQRKAQMNVKVSWCLVVVVVFLLFTRVILDPHL